MKKINVTAIVALAFASFLAGCDGDGSVLGAAPPPPPPPPPPPAPLVWDQANWDEVVWQ